jgi:hypothetical protein
MVYGGIFFADFAQLFAHAAYRWILSQYLSIGQALPPHRFLGWQPA